MSTWLPPLLSGAFSIVVVLLGALLVSKREDKANQEKWRREDLEAQRKAVATFIEDWRMEHHARRSRPFSLAVTTASMIDNSNEARAHHMKKLQLVEVLALNIKDPEVSNAVEKLEESIKGEEAGTPSESVAYAELRKVARDRLLPSPLHKGLYT